MSDVRVRGVPIRSARCALCGALVDLCSPEAYELRGNVPVHTSCEDQYIAFVWNAETRARPHT